MPTNNEVSVAWQIVFTFLPVVNFWAFYRVKKLRKYVLYVIVPEIALAVIVIAYTFGNIIDLQMKAEKPLSIERLTFFGSAFRMTVGQVIGVGLQGFSIYLVIIWSRQHNKQFDQPTTQTEQ